MASLTAAHLNLSRDELLTSIRRIDIINPRQPHTWPGVTLSFTHAGTATYYQITAATTHGVTLTPIRVIGEDTPIIPSHVVKRLSVTDITEILNREKAARAPFGRNAA